MAASFFSGARSSLRPSRFSSRISKSRCRRSAAAESQLIVSGLMAEVHLCDLPVVVPQDPQRVQHLPLDLNHAHTSFFFGSLAPISGKRKPSGRKRCSIFHRNRVPFLFVLRTAAAFCSGNTGIPVFSKLVAFSLASDKKSPWVELTHGEKGDGDVLTCLQARHPAAPAWRPHTRRCRQSSACCGCAPEALHRTDRRTGSC